MKRAGAICAVAFGACAPAFANEPASQAGQVSLGKALAFETMSSALETSLFAAFFGGGLAAAAPVMALSFSTSLGVYMFNDYAWSLAPAPAPQDENARVAAKAATFRGMTLVRSYAIGAWLGGAKAAAPLAYALTFNVADTALFVGVEKLLGVGGAGEAPEGAPSREGAALASSETGPSVTP